VKKISILREINKVLARYIISDFSNENEERHKRHLQYELMSLLNKFRDHAEIWNFFINAENTHDVMIRVQFHSVWEEYRFDLSDKETFQAVIDDIVTEEVINS
jgi:hypothetical protein